MRRKGSAAPHNSWSPMVKAPTYSGPIANLRMRPTGIVMVPVTATGVKSCTVSSRLLGTTFTQGLSAAIISSMLATGTFFFSLKVHAWLWPRLAPTSTQKPSTGMGALPKSSPSPRSFVVAAMPFHAPRLWPQPASSRFLPIPKSLSIQGISVPHSGTPKLAVSAALMPRRRATTLRSISKWRF